MDRNLNSTIERILRDGRRRLNEADRAMIGQIIGSYEQSRLVIIGELMNLEEQIQWAIDNHEGELTEAWMRRQVWFEGLDRSIEAEVQRLEAMTRDLSNTARTAGGSQGSVVAAQTIAAVPGVPSVNAGAVERWISSIQPGSPLDRVLGQFGPDMERTLVTEITSGLIEGRGSSNVIRRAVMGIEDVDITYKSSRIVRTEMMRSYRGVYRDQVDSLPDGMVAGWRWIAAVGDPRTCLQCLAMHNQVFTEYPGYQHVMCRCSAAPVFSPRYAPPQEFETGDMWFAQQPEEVQRRILGPGRYEKYQEGVSLRGMVQLQDDPTWGGTTRLIPIRDLRP